MSLVRSCVPKFDLLVQILHNDKLYDVDIDFIDQELEICKLNCILLYLNNNKRSF